MRACCGARPPLVHGPRSAGVGHDDRRHLAGASGCPDGRATAPPSLLDPGGRRGRPVPRLGPRALKAIGQPATVRILSREGLGGPEADAAVSDPALTRPADRRALVTVTVRLTDRDSGVRRVSLSLFGPEVAMARAASTPRSGACPARSTTASGRAPRPCRRARQCTGRWSLYVAAVDATNFTSLLKPRSVAVANHDVLRPTAFAPATSCAPPAR